MEGQIWDLFEGNHPFGDILDNNGNHDLFKHLVLMVALIGPPPADLVERSETTGQCFDHNGKRRRLRIQSFP
jgi:non-specific serine/threonine protein kinase